MRIHALQTGSVSVKHAFLFPRDGVRRQLDLFLPGPWSAPLPILCWAVEHDGRLYLVDTGESARARDVPFARFQVRVDDELPAAMAAAGLDVNRVDVAVLTHHHGDHIDGVGHLPGAVQIHAEELEFTRQAFPTLMRRVLRQPLPEPLRAEPFTLDERPFGSFTRSRDLSGDGRIVAIPTPGHTPGHISVICVDDDGRHVMLAGDVADSLEQLLAQRADAVAPSVAVHRATLATVLAHAARHPTVFLPSHDPDSPQRLAAAETVGADGRA
jgi:glyoxylase-like metal-dependent hydrolase (beta-lactamase superfamily II)